jgi:hypothetical protein
MSRLSWLFAALSLVAAACVDDTTHSEPGPVVGPAITPGSNDTKVRVTPTSGLGVTERGGTATFTVELTRQPTHDVTIHLYVDDDTEATVDTEVLVFTPTSYGPRTVTVTGVDDGEDDGNQPFHVVLDEAISRDLRYQSVEAADVRITNVDDDAVGVTVLAADNLATSEAGGTATFTVQLSTRPSSAVVVRLDNPDPSEVTASAAELRFLPGNWQTAQTVTLTGVDDQDDDGNVTVTIGTSIESSDDAYAAIDPADVVVTNADDEEPGVVGLPPTSPINGYEGSYAYIYGIRLNSQPSATVILRARSADGLINATDYIYASDWQYEQSMYINIPQNQDIDGDRDVAVAFSTESADPAYNGLELGTGTIHITDDDRASMSLYVYSYQREDSTYCGTVEVSLGSRPTAVTTVRITSSDETELTIPSPVLTFGPGLPTRITTNACVVDDDEVDGTQMVTVTAAIEATTDANYQNLPARTYAAYVEDDDFHAVLENVYNVYYTDPLTVAPFRIQLGHAPTHDVTFAIATSNPQQAVTSVSTLTFTPDDWATPQTFLLEGVDNGVNDSYVAYQVTVGPAVSEDPAFAGLSFSDSLYGEN